LAKQKEGKNMSRVIIALLLMVSCVSCSLNSHHLSASEILPRKGYMFIKKTILLKSCENNQCVEGRSVSVGSGFIVKIAYNGSYVMTAAHVCNGGAAGLLEGVETSTMLQAETLDGRVFSAEVLDSNREMDICMMFVKDLMAGVEEVKVAPNAPDEGDKVFNIASPYGVHYKDVVPIFEGRYIGRKGYRSFYTFDAAPGSSGSMILNSDGELIGLLHSVYRDMMSIIVSANYGDLKAFIRKAIIEHERKTNLNSRYIYENNSNYMLN